MSIENRLHLESCVDAWRDLIDSFNVVLSFSPWKETDWREDRTNRGVVRVESVPRVVGREIIMLCCGIQHGLSVYTKHVTNTEVRLNPSRQRAQRQRKSLGDVFVASLKK